MKNFLALAAIASAFACSAAEAATISAKPLTSATGVYSLYIDGESDVFDTVEVLVSPTAGVTFINNNSGNGATGPRPAGESFTYLNRRLNGDPLDDPANKGWSVLGLVNTANSFGFTGGPLGQTISTSGETDGDLFLANLMFNSPGGSALATVKTYRLGEVVANLELPIPIPEPATFALAGLGLVGLVAASRRKA